MGVLSHAYSSTYCQGRVRRGHGRIWPARRPHRRRLHRRHSATRHERQRRVLRDQHRHCERAGAGRGWRCRRLLIRLRGREWPGVGDCFRPFSSVQGGTMLDLQTIVLLQKSIAYVSMALLVVAAYSDIRTLRIPNVLVLAIAALGILRLVLLGNPIAAIYAIGFGVLFFVIGALLFSRGIIG